MDFFGNNCMEEILKKFSIRLKLFNNMFCLFNIIENKYCNSIK